LDELTNPCIGCRDHWAADRHCDCSDGCKSFEIYEKAKNLLKGIFGINFDELHMKFHDFYSRKKREVTFEETQLIREIFEFIKKEINT
jgi:hypothetical protein